MIGDKSVKFINNRRDNRRLKSNNSSLTILISDLEKTTVAVICTRDPCIYAQKSRVRVIVSASYSTAGLT